MSSPTPVQSLIAGLCLALPVHFLKVLNGNVFGISGFLHRAVRGSKEALVAVSGLVVGGVIVGLTERTGQRPIVDLRRTLVASLLVGFGTKLSNGCTSGHMVCGVSRLSLRSIVATGTFFITGVITAALVHNDLPASHSADWSLGPYGKTFLVLQTIPLAILLSLYYYASSDVDCKPEVQQSEETPLLQSASPQILFRRLTFLAASVEFALALRLSGLTDPVRVVSFLLLPFHRAFDVSLAFLALGVLPLSILLYKYTRGSEKPRLGGEWAIPKGGEIDANLLVGAAIFGVGWGLAGICPGPGLVNLGRALVTGTGLMHHLTWAAGVVIGGLLA
ncbi:hypothetical protein M378DRAFT_68569 [Amanita muscaria Koide BX008]|uniref:Uncharacterized protein n=1 Tax=Amanita muscaria (strain Koide BX008) TaxID=946122 RepID=A0A0C2X6G5_AMAMK|nr:hypothetical protein M378DRAFT_68569 [Amanita muscaria Koide BX008]